MTIVASRLCRAALALPALLASGAASSHPGHDTAPAMGLWQGLAHLLTQPDHLGMLVAALGIGVVAWRSWRRGLHRGGARAGRR